MQQHFLHFEAVSGRYKDTSRRSLELPLKLLSPARELPRNARVHSRAHPSPSRTTGPSALSPWAGSRHFPPAPAPPEPQEPVPRRACPAAPTVPSGSARSSPRRRRARPCTAPLPPGWAGWADGAGRPPSGTAPNGCGSRRQNLILAGIGERLRARASEWGTGIEERLWTRVSEWGAGIGERLWTGVSEWGTGVGERLVGAGVSEWGTGTREGSRAAGGRFGIRAGREGSLGQGHWRGQSDEGGRVVERALMRPCSRCLRAEAAASLGFTPRGQCGWAGTAILQEERGGFAMFWSLRGFPSPLLAASFAANRGFAASLRPSVTINFVWSQGP